MKNNAYDLDQFYTNPKVSDQLVKELIRHKIIIDSNVILEPSAGSGNFIDSIKKLTKIKKIEAYDIDPKENKKIKKADYLKTQINFNEKRIIIGNPPFGKRGLLALEFLNKGFQEAETIAMILPKTFNRFSIQNKINPNAKLLYSWNLEKDSFIINDRSYDVNCVFQVWTLSKKYSQKKNLRLKNPLPIKHSDLKTFIHNNTKKTQKYFDKKLYKWNFAVHRQGYYDYSKLITDTNLLIKNRQYFFIKCLNNDAKKLVKKIDFNKLSKSNTSTPGFSTTDFINEYRKLKGEI